MKQANQSIIDLLDMDLPEAAEDVLWKAYKPTSAQSDAGDIFFTIPFQAQTIQNLWMQPDKEKDRKSCELRIRAYGDDIIRVSIAFDGAMPDDTSSMLEFHESLHHEPLSLIQEENAWRVTDSRGRIRFRIDNNDPVIHHWSDLLAGPQETMNATVYPDGLAKVPFMAWDQFSHMASDSIALGYVTRKNKPDRATFSLHALPNEHFAGTGERFTRMDLAGKTFTLENTDGLGVNNRRCYKNIPFYLSSKNYGLLMHTSTHVRLSLADISTRAAQAMIEEPIIDLFFIGGGSLERIVYNYRRLTGFPNNVPLWSYGTWMSRMTYFSEEEVKSIAQRLRDEDFPCDVIHLDTGWFAKDWICEWEFSKERFPDPARFMQDMRKQGYRITLWQMPNITDANKLYKEAVEKRYLAPRKGSETGGGSDFSFQNYAGQIDFSNPEAVKWYQEMVKHLLEIGAVAMKTDFGENVNMDADYFSVPAKLLHNLYALLYQKAAWDITKETTGEPIIWARAGWTGCQRYPVHWGGDCACTWDGMAGSLKGGLHLAASGFAFWSHDVPGFHGVPNFMNSRPSNSLYVRWTQFGVSTSHLRYHGTSAREPYEYPEVTDVVRKWLKLRYALIPYLMAQGKKATQTGYSVLRPLIFDNENDPQCWSIDDEILCGDDILVAPVMNDESIRNVYLPTGEWVDFWTGRIMPGRQWLFDIKSPLEHMPIFVKKGARIPIYPESVKCTDEMDLGKSVEVIFDDGFSGISQTVIGRVTGL